MVTKAGAPTSKVIVGISSYGRSFKMATPGCSGPTCTFTGGQDASDATPGRCTGTAGILADAEIKEIISKGNVEQRLDPVSNSNILVYSGSQYVAYMDEATKASRISLYQAMSFGGISDWSVDLQTFEYDKKLVPPVPSSASSKTPSSSEIDSAFPRLTSQTPSPTRETLNQPPSATVEIPFPGLEV